MVVSRLVLRLVVVGLALVLDRGVVAIVIRGVGHDL